jgi:hypothetical protein
MESGGQPRPKQPSLVPHSLRQGLIRAGAAQRRVVRIERTDHRVEYTERLRDVQEDIQADRGLTAFEPPQRVPVNSGALSDLCCGEVLELAPSAKVSAERHCCSSGLGWNSFAHLITSGDLTLSHNTRCSTH